MSLWSDFQTNQGRVVHKWKHYFSAYEAHFARYVNRPVLMFEIGVSRGGSLQMWKRYLGPHALIVGLDINPDCQGFEEDQIRVRIGDQSDTVFLGELLREFGAPDIVLDDGSHVMSHVSQSFRYLYPRMSPSGVYFVEDMHTAYMPNYEGGLGREGSFIEISKHLIDELNADWTNGALAPTDFSRNTISMHFYDSCVVFERGRVLPKTEFQIGSS